MIRTLKIQENVCTKGEFTEKTQFLDNFRTLIDFANNAIFEASFTMNCDVFEKVELKLRHGMQILEGKTGSPRHRNFQHFYNFNYYD